MLEALLLGLATIVLGIILMGVGFFGSDMGMAFTDAFNFIVSLKWLTVPLAGILTVVLWAVILFLICLPQLVLAGWKTKRYAEKAPEHLGVGNVPHRRRMRGRAGPRRIRAGLRGAHDCTGRNRLRLLRHVPVVEGQRRVARKPARTAEKGP